MSSKLINQYTIEDAGIPGAIVLSIKTPWIRIGAELLNQTLSSPSTRRSLGIKPDGQVMKTHHNWVKWCDH